MSFFLKYVFTTTNVRSIVCLETNNQIVDNIVRASLYYSLHNFHDVPTNFYPLYFS